MSTRSMASRRPENSSQIATSLCVTVATDTGVAGGAAAAGADAAVEGLWVTMPATTAATTAMAATAMSRRLRSDVDFIRASPWIGGLGCWVGAVWRRFHGARFV